MKNKYFIDTDTASDDAVALLMALEWEDVEVLGISVVSGNMSVEQGSINARYTVELCKKDVPVYVGADAPLVKKREHADWFHGPDGMGNMNYPAPKLQETNEDFIEVLNNHINQHPDEITLVTLGPLTNVANFIKKYPDSFLKLKNIVIMGGASNTVGNVTPAAEYNIWCDPEAADIVFKSKHHDIAMVGWELCRGEANLTEEEMELAYSFKTEKADFTIDCNKHALDSSQNWLGDPGLGLPDPVAMAVALNPAVTTKVSRHNVQVVIDGPARGMTIVDQLHVGESEPHIDEHWSHTERNINVIWEIDSDEWKETLYKTIRD
ncbi:nucleoside hydrolase [Acidimicrobiia bacterium]|jgi:purine nucleosidase|nr:nucleoside hydrolase [Acidimicrobiia bacterium]HCG90890.1 nucleoside hydrolase [Dehalococcoidia bacterium]MDB4237402.1 nucleoside hydrolase [Acidimicrobiia bacterium]MDC0866693.1 nucleoside hydrolase [Acidimicrobiia bacterium]MDC0977874.1 nucleoside hydrolase [Acidimicrobiia bacterium]